MKTLQTTVLMTLLVVFASVDTFAQGSSPNLQAPHVSTSQAQKEVTINQAVDQLDNAIAGNISINVGGSSNVTLTTAQAQYNAITFTGTLSANISVIVPSRSKQWTIFNNTSGAFTVTVKTAAGTGIAVTQGVRTILQCDATNVYTALTSSTQVVAAAVTANVQSAPYNASGSSVMTTSVGTTSPGTALNVASGSSFAVNQGIFIAGAGAAGANYIGTISAINGTAFTVSPATSTSIAAGAKVQHDDTVAIQTAISAVYNLSGGIVYFPRGVYRCNGPWQSPYNSILYIPQNAFANNNPIVSVKLLGEFHQPYGNIATTAQGVAIVTTDVTASGTQPAVLAAAPYLDTGAGQTNFSMVCPNIENINFRTNNNPTFSVLQFSTAIEAVLRNVSIDTLAGDVSVVQPTTTTSYGVWLPQTNNETLIRADNVWVVGFYNGFRFSEHAIMEMCVAAFDMVGYVADKSTRPGWGYVSVAECPTNIQFIGGVSEVDLNVDIENDYGASWYSRVNGKDVSDVSNYGHGRITYHITKAGTGETVDVMNNTGGGNLVLYNTYLNGDPKIQNTTSTSYITRQFGGNATIFADSGPAAAAHSVNFNNNAYYDPGAGGWHYISTDSATNILQNAGAFSFRIAPSGTAGAALTWVTPLQLTNPGSIVLGNAALGTTATDGFLYIPSMAGLPTGVPTTFSGRLPLVYDTTDNKFCVYNAGAWKCVLLN